MMSKSLLYIVLLAAVATGCSESEESDVQAAPAATQVASEMVVTTAPTAAEPPPGMPVATAIASPGNSMPEAIASDGSLASYVTPHASAYFQDGDGEFIAKSAQEVVERAVVAYREIQSTKHDDSPDWPVLSDLSLLVKYKILRALPPAPSGQKFVYDAATRKVLLTSN